MTNRLLAKTSAFALAAAIAAPATIVPAMAQDDEIVVTGTFIRKKSQADLPSPLQTVTAGDIDAVGAQNIADLTQTLTINTGAQNNPDAFTQNQTTGTSNINLRGLGVGSTLVLLNGRRQVLTGASTNDGVSFVDTASLVPLIAVERVEILKDGASALYGSDAVAGVVNFLTRDNYDGILLSGDYVSHQGEGDYNEFNIQGLIGKDFDRFSVMAAVSYLERTELTTEERRLSEFGGVNQDVSILGNPGAFFGLPGLPAGAPAIDPGCAAAGGLPTPASPLDPTAAVVGFCGFDFGDFFTLVPEEQRLNIYGQIEADITDSINWRFEGGYADNEAIRGNSPTFPLLTLNEAVIPGADLAPFGITANPNNLFPGSPTLVFLGRASGNGGTVSPNLTASETWRLSTAIGGDDILRNGAWEISFTRGRNNFTVMTEDVVADRFQCGLSGFQSLPAIPGLTTGTDCTSANPNLTANGAVIPAAGTFFNPFSSSLLGSPSPAGLLDYFVEFQTRDFQSDLTVVEGFISSEIFDLPAGPVSIAVGGQYRDNDLEATFDQLSEADAFGFLVGDQAFGGSQDVFAGFAEVAIPLAPWLDLQAAVRHERYGDDEGGSTTDPKIALLARPHDRISLRGSYSTSFRAPSVFQQVGQGTTLQQVIDPLSGVAFVAVRQSGNPDLEPEDSRAFNFGGTFEPVDGLTLNVDYYNFNFDNFIVPVNPQALVNADPNDPRVIRAPGGGTILQINTDFINAASVETSGLDFSANWAIETDNLGTFTPTFEGTYILSYDLQETVGGPVIDGAGNRNFNNFGDSTPELRFNAGISWVNGAHSANVFVRRIGSYTDDQNNVDVRADTRLDVQYALAINEYMNRDKLAQVTIGGRNITGTRPPFVATNGGFDSRVADPRGPLLYFGLDVEF